MDDFWKDNVKLSDAEIDSAEMNGKFSREVAASLKVQKAAEKDLNSLKSK